MKWILFYKTRYTKKITGPHMRYIELSRQLKRIGEDPIIVGHSAEAGVIQSDIHFVSYTTPLKFLRELLDSNVIVLHGGGPSFVLFALLLSLMSNKKVLLDAYAPHWIELSEIWRKDGSRRNAKLFVKIYYNFLRTNLAIQAFDGVIVGNLRQKDLLRGILSTSSGVRYFDTIYPLTFGAEPPLAYRDRTKLQEALSSPLPSGAFVIGWLGGTWNWFNYSTIASAFSRIIEDDPSIYLVFFGADREFSENFSRLISKSSQNNILFANWIDYEARLSAWSGLDLAIVWGGSGFENDYASRTRNVDCASAGVPIIQNWDDDWGAIIEKNKLGKTTDAKNLADDILLLRNNEEELRALRENIHRYSERISWRIFCDQLMLAINKPKRPRILRALAAAIVVMGIPFGLLSFLIAYVGWEQTQ